MNKKISNRSSSTRRIIISISTGRKRTRRRSMSLRRRQNTTRSISMSRNSNTRRTILKSLRRQRGRTRHGNGQMNHSSSTRTRGPTKRRQQRKHSRGLQLRRRTRRLIKIPHLRPRLIIRPISSKLRQHINSSHSNKEHYRLITYTIINNMKANSLMISTLTKRLRINGLRTRRQPLKSTHNGTRNSTLTEKYNDTISIRAIRTLRRNSTHNKTIGNHTLKRLRNRKQSILTKLSHSLPNGTHIRDTSSTKTTILIKLNNNLLNNRNGHYLQNNRNRTTEHRRRHNGRNHRHIHRATSLTQRLRLLSVHGP